MKVSEVLAKAIRNEIRWVDAAAILGISDRQCRRWRLKFQAEGAEGLRDARLGKVPGNRVSEATVRRVLELYEQSYADFNARHFWEELTEEHGIQVSYSWTKSLLLRTGLRTRSPRKRVYRRRRERRPMRGMLVHFDGSKHRWFESREGEMQDLLVSLDDATGEILDGLFVPEEGARTFLLQLRRVIEEHGTFGALYTDRASHFAYTPKAGGDVDKSRRTQVGRVLDELGTELILAYSPQARGRSERLWRTLQGRVPQELRRAGVRTYEDANTYFRTRYISRFNKRFAVPAAEEGSAFVPLAGVDAEQLFTFRFERIVTNDYTVRFQGRVLQLPKAPGVNLCRRSVQVRVGLEGQIWVYLGSRRVASFEGDPSELDTEGLLLEAA